MRGQEEVTVTVLHVVPGGRLTPAPGPVAVGITAPRQTLTSPGVVAGRGEPPTGPPVGNAGGVGPATQSESPVKVLQRFVRCEITTTLII